LIYEKIIPENAFEVKGNIHDVSCVFQIWVKKKHKRKTKEKLFPKGFVFCEKSGHPDVAIRKVGDRAGDVYTDWKGKTNVYYIRFTNGKSVRRNIGNIRKAKFNLNNNTAIPLHLNEIT
jgi:hypothetical protein